MFLSTPSKVTDPSRHRSVRCLRLLGLASWGVDKGPKDQRNRRILQTQKVHVTMWYTSGAQRGSYMPTLGSMYVLE